MPKHAPLITSSLALRGFATAVTLLSATSMTAFAATHVQNTAAPLKPTAPEATTVVAVATPTPAPTSARRRTTVAPGVTTTTGTARTKTHSS